MDKTAALIILRDFLMKRNKYGTFKFYEISEYNRHNNIKIIRNKAEQIDKTLPTETNLRKAHFKSIIGSMYSSRGNILGDNYLYKIYLEWCDYIDKNWTSIDKQYINLKTKINNGKNI